MRGFILQPIRIFLATGAALALVGPWMARADVGARFTLCKLSKEVRTLRIERDKETGGCETAYSKFGKDQIVGHGQNYNSCSEILDRVKANLEEAGWKCREVKTSTASSLNADAQ